MACDFLQLTSAICVTQANGVNAAFITGCFLLSSIALKFLLDYVLKRRFDAFETKQKKEIELYLSQQKWRDERRQERLSRIQKSAEYLDETWSGVSKLVNSGPAYDDFTMITETAVVLQSFARYKEQVNHFSLYEEFTKQGKIVLEHVTRIVLTLSPSKASRESTERQKNLALLLENLDIERKAYLAICRRFEEAPNLFGAN